MSRIEEALTRARRIRPDDLPVVPPPIDEGAAPEFTREASAEVDVLGEPSPHPIDSGESASKALDAPIGGTEPELDGRVVEIEADLLSLPTVEKLAVGQAHSTPVEQYRRLAARLLLAQAEHGTRIVMVTSALANEGKTLTATNLALTLSESYKRNVLLIDADLRRPAVHQIFQIPNVSGLNDGLRSDQDRKLPLLRFTDNLSILTAGKPDADPMSVLSGERLRLVLEEAGSRFDCVILDTPPVALLTDAHLLASLVDAVFLVIETGRTQLPALKSAVQSIGRDRILGVVLNRAGASGNGYYGYYGSYRS